MAAQAEQMCISDADAMRTRSASHEALLRFRADSILFAITSAFDNAEVKRRVIYIIEEIDRHARIDVARVASLPSGLRDIALRAHSDSQKDER